MKKKIIATVIVIGLVLGMFGISSAQPLNEAVETEQGTVQADGVEPVQTETPEETASPSPAASEEPVLPSVPKESGQPQPGATAAQQAASASDGQTEAESGQEILLAPDAGSTAEDGVIEITELSQITGSGSYRLAEDITPEAGVTIAAGENVSLDLNGHKIAAEIQNILVNEGALSVTDSASGGTIQAQSGCIRNLGTLTINGGHYMTTDNQAGCALYNGSGATLVINDCTVDAAFFAVGNLGDCTINGGQFHSTSSNAAGAYAYCIKSMGEGANLTINNATVTGIQGAVAAVQGTVTVYDGHFSTEQGNSNSFYALYVAGEEGEVSGTVYDGTYSSPKSAVYIGNDNTNGDGGINARACLNIRGGNFTGGDAALIKAKNTGATFISGGTFTDGSGQSGIENYVADGYTVKNDSDGSVSVVEQVLSVSNETTGAKYATIQQAVDAAGEGDVICITANGSSYDEAVTLTKAVTLKGPGDGSAVLTGGITLAGPFGDNTQTVIKGLKFEKSGIYAIAWGSEPNLNNLTIENNIFENISAWSAAVNFNLANTSPVRNLTIADNTITNVTAENGSGIWVSAVAGTTRITGNRIDGTKLNSIQVTGMAAGDVTISRNILKNWDSDIAGGGRAMRLTANGNGSMTITENSMARTLAAGEDGAQAVKITELTGTLNASRNYWNAAKPDFSAVLKAYTDGGSTAAGGTQISVKPYYADEALTKLVSYDVRNERTGETYDTLQKAVNKAQAGDTLLLGNDCAFGTTTQTGYDEDNIGYGTYGSFNKSLTIRSEGTACTIVATSIVTVNNGAQVVLENVTVDGENRIGTSGINVQGSSTLTLGNGATVKGCATSSGRSAIDVGSAGGTGGEGKLVMNEGSLITQNVNSGIWLEPDGIFEMNGGRIANNNCQPTALSKQAYGLVISGGKAVMNGGEIFGNGASIAGGGVSMNKSGSVLTVNGGVISNNTKNGSIYVTAADCTVTLHDAVITGNSVSSYGSVGGSSSATNFNVYLSGNTQITGNKYGSTACNLKTSANMTVDVTGLAAGAQIGVTPYSKAAGCEVASAADAQSVRMECFTPDSALNTNVSLVRVGNKLMTGYTTTINAAGLENSQFEYTGTAPVPRLQGASLQAANGTEIAEPEVGFVYYADNNGQPGTELDSAPAAAGTYWARPVYDGSVTGSYGASQGTDAYQYRIVIPVSGVSLNKGAVSLEMGTKGQLSAAVSPADAYDKTVTWSSSSEAVVKVDKGMITPVAPGTATVTATSCNGKSASCTVTVIVPPETKPVLPDTEGKTQVVVEPEIKGNTVDADAVKNAIANAKPEEAVVVKVETKSGEEARDIKVGADVVEQAAKAAADGTGAKTVAFSMADASGNVAAAVTLDLSRGVDPEKLKDINLGFSNTVSASVEQKAKETIPADATVMFINLTHNGEFPCPITRMDKVGSSFRPGDTVYLYYAGASGLSEEQVLTVDANGYITYTISHASPYMVTDMRSVVDADNPGGSETPGIDSPGGNGLPGTDDPGTGQGDGSVTYGSGDSGNDPVVVDETDGSVKPVSTAADDTKTTTPPRTGDVQDISPYLWLLVVAGGIITAGTVIANKRRKIEK
ncbi:Ig-like domain-containing protein [Christensenella hongkongensis]|uniref:Ig-like domain-containing protein n=1 Tax=Christensenella hongkongensis TaxID=270498 RepID=UPI0026734732|nr:Ig-like domain-containing protein [Christensenella hongkongensis]